MIRELPLEVRSKIAAGEVIERPVSVVKELVENALDAGATDIKVSVINGGLDEIMVSDNGCGMPFEELPLAVKRFTTSKIGSVEDLDSIATLGFRGEALASIADVADLTIFSCDGETSGQLRIRGGELLLCKPVASPKGTRVIVRDLFLICQPVRNFFGLLPQNFPISRSSCSPWYSFTQMFSGLSPAKKASFGMSHRSYLRRSGSTAYLVKKPNFVLSQLRRANWTFI